MHVPRDDFCGGDGERVAHASPLHPEPVGEHSADGRAAPGAERSAYRVFRARPGRCTPEPNLVGPRELVEQHGGSGRTRAVQCLLPRCGCWLALAVGELPAAHGCITGRKRLMCGVVGFFGERDIDLRAAARAILHRGPDMQGIAAGRGWKVAFNRLSIIDTSENGMQPFT